MSGEPTLRLDRTVARPVLPEEAADPRADTRYWLARTPGERFEAAELLRRIAFGPYPRLPRRGAEGEEGA